MAKKCPPGKYYCFDDKKCKKIPRGYRIGARGYLARDTKDDDNETKKNGNGNSNGNGNGGNGSGNGNGGSSGNGGGNGGGGVSEDVEYNYPNVRRNRRFSTGMKMSMNPATGMGAKKSTKNNPDGDDIRNSTYNQIKKLERKKEAQARRTSSKIVGIKKKRVSEELNKDDKPFIQKLIGKLRKGSKTHAKQADDLEKTMKEESNPRIPRKKGQPAKSKKHSDLYTDEDPKGTIHGLGFKDVAKAKASVSKIRNSSRSHAHKIQAAVAMEQRAREMGKTSEAAVYRKYINSMKKKTKKMNEAANPAQQAAIAIDMKRKGKKPKSVKEETMTPAQKRKDTMLKKKYDKSDMKKSMQKQYGKEEGKKVYFATIRKQAMEGVEDDKYNVSEEGLRDWFGKSSGTTKSGRKVRGWVQVGGKYDGKPCARQPGQKSTPKCVSSSKRRSMSKSERDSAARRKRAADPNQPQKSGAAKPTNVSTDPKKKMSENYFNEAKDKKGKGSGTKDACYHKVKSRYSVWPSAYASGALVKCRKVGAANWGNKTKKEGFSPMQVSALEAAGMIEIKEGQKCWKGYEKKGTKMMFGKRYNNCVKKKSTKESVEFDEGMMDTVKTVGKKVLKKTKEFINKPIVEPTITGSQYKQQVQSGTTHKNVMDSVETFAKVTEGVAFLKREKEKKKSSSEYLTQRDAGKLAKRKMAKKDQEKVNFLEPEETNESKTRLVKNGHTYKVVLTWRGKTYMVQMFVPSVSRPTRQEVEKEVQKLYPDAKVMSFLPRDLEPGEPTVMMGEEKHERDEYGDIVGGPKISKKEKKKNLEKNEKDEDHTTTTSEAYSSKPSNLRKKAKLTAALNRLQDLKVKKKMKEEVEVVEAKYEAGASTYGKASIRNKRRFGTKGENPDPLTGKKITKDATRGELIAKRREAHKEKRGVKTKVKSYHYPLELKKEEVNIVEDDMKGMSVKSGHKRPTKKGAGMTQKGVEAYRRRNPGSKLKTAVTGKVKKGSKDAKRRKSYCARSAGQMKKFPKAAKDPNSRLRQARRRWKC